MFWKLLRLLLAILDSRIFFNNIVAKVHEDFFLAMTKEKKTDPGAVTIFSDNFNLGTDQVVIVADTSLEDSDECILQYRKMRLGLDETHLVFEIR